MWWNHIVGLQTKQSLFPKLYLALFTSRGSTQELPLSLQNFNNFIIYKLLNFQEKLCKIAVTPYCRTILHYRLLLATECTNACCYVTSSCDSGPVNLNHSLALALQLKQDFIMSNTAVCSVCFSHSASPWVDCSWSCLGSRLMIN